jgi:hypothetical protein
MQIIHRRRLLSITVLLLHIATILAIPWGGDDSVSTPSGGGKETIFHSVVEIERIERDTNEIVVRPDKIASKEEKTANFPKRLLHVAKSLLGRAVDVILSKTTLRGPGYDAGNYDGVEPTFDDLDRIIENTNATINDELLHHQHHLLDADDGEEYVDDGWLLKTFWPPLAQGASLLSGRKQQLTLLHRMNKVREVKNITQLSHCFKLSHTKEYILLLSRSFNQARRPRHSKQFVA